MPAEITVPEKALAQRPSTPMDLLQLAIERAGSIDVIERLAKLQAEMMDREAKNEYIRAFEEFKRNVPPIVKDSAIVVNGQVRGKYSKLDKICNVLIPELLKVGITHRWKTRTSENGQMVFVTCYLRHRNGYEEEGSTLGGPPDVSGSKNAIQSSGSTMAYLQRYTLVGSCGIAIKDQDRDGNPAPEEETETMSEATVLEWVDAMNQAPDLTALKGVFADCWAKAKALRDSAAKAEFQKTYEARKRRLGAQ